MKQVTFTCEYPLTAGPPGGPFPPVPRPMVEVVATYAGSTQRRLCLVDTGADDTILDRGAAEAFGVYPPEMKLPQENVVVGNGQRVAFGRLTNVRLEFAGTTILEAAGLAVLIGPVAIPLLGRSALLHVAGGLRTVGFEAATWMHT